jgi:hypothetical protein
METTYRLGWVKIHHSRLGKWRRWKTSGHQTAIKAVPKYDVRGSASAVASIGFRDGIHTVVIRIAKSARIRNLLRGCC